MSLIGIEVGLAFLRLACYRRHRVLSKIVGEIEVYVSYILTWWRRH